MFLYVKRVNTLQRSSVKKNKNCKERIEAKVGICMCLLEINTID